MTQIKLKMPGVYESKKQDRKLPKKHRRKKDGKQALSME
jgi:hypothetical protein